MASVPLFARRCDYVGLGRGICTNNIVSANMTLDEQKGVLASVISDFLWPTPVPQLMQGCQGRRGDHPLG